MKGLILFYFLPDPNLIAPKTMDSPSPVLLDIQTFFRIPPQLLPRVFGWLLRLIINWRPPKAVTNFIIYIFFAR